LLPPRPNKPAENYFSMLKSRLQKLNGLTHEKLKENIQYTINHIPKEKYENIFKGSYNRDVFVRKASRINNFIKIDYIKWAFQMRKGVK
jgi:hypothetical protein